MYLGQLVLVVVAMTVVGEQGKEYTLEISKVKRLQGKKMILLEYLLYYLFSYNCVHKTYYVLTFYICHVTYYVCVYMQVWVVLRLVA